MKFSISVFTLALAATASAIPTLPARSAAPAPVPAGAPTSDVCFRLLSSTNKWLECDDSGPLNFKSSAKKSGLFILDPQSNLRNAYTGSLASRDPIGHHNYGHVEMNRNGKVDKGDDKLCCWREGTTLKCVVGDGDDTYEKGSMLYVGKDLEKQSRLAKRVVLSVVEEKCHVPNVWTTWNL